jgi:hypothetical protein
MGFGVVLDKLGRHPAWLGLRLLYAAYSVAGHANGIFYLPWGPGGLGVFRDLFCAFSSSPWAILCGHFISSIRETYLCHLDDVNLLSEYEIDITVALALEEALAPSSIATTRQ